MLNSKTTLGDLINSILSDTTIYNTVESLVDTVLDIALVFVWFLFAINMAIIYVKALMNSESLSFSSIKGGLIRALIVVAIMNAYKPFVYTVDGIFMSIYNEMRDGAIIDENGVADYMEKRTNFNGKIESYVGSSEATEEVSFLEKAAEVVTSPSQSIKNSASGVVFSVIHNILSTVLGVIGAIMLLIAWVIIQIFKIIGPLAMLFSVLDIWGGNWMKWFNAYVGSYGAMIVVLLFASIQSGIAAVGAQADGMSSLGFLAIDIVMIGMYLSAFRIGSYIVGDDVGSSMIDNTLKGITAGATSATAYGSTAGRAALTTVKVGARTAAGTATSLRDAGTLARKGLLGSTVREGANNAMYSAGNTIKSAKDKLDNTSIFRK